MTSHSLEEVEYPISKVIEDLKKGAVRFRDLEADVRREVVDLLKMEGLKQPAIAQMCRCSSKTIQRVHVEILEENKIQPSTKLSEETVGEFRRLFYHHLSALTRMARNSSLSPREQLDATNSAWRVVVDYIEKMCAMGYLPTAVQQISNKVSHSIEGLEGKSWDEFRIEIDRIKIAARESQKMTPELEQELLKITEHIDKAQIGEKIENVIQQREITSEGESHG